MKYYLPHSLCCYSVGKHFFKLEQIRRTARTHYTTLLYGLVKAELRIVVFTQPFPPLFFSCGLFPIFSV